MDGIPTVLLDGHINALARLRHKHSQTSFVSLIILWVMVLKFIFLGGSLVSEQFPNIYIVVRLRNSVISLVLVSFSSISWNFNFCPNLLEQEIEELAHLMFALVHVFLFY